MSRLVTSTDLIHIAPGVYVTIAGALETDPPAGSRVVDTLPLPPVGPDVIELLADWGEKSTKEKIEDVLNLRGDTADLFTKAWTLGETVAGVYSGYTFATEVFNALSGGSSEELKALKDIQAAIGALDKKVDAFVNFVKADKKKDIDYSMDTFEVELRHFLDDPPALSEALKAPLHNLQGELKLILDANYLDKVLSEPYKPFQYHTAAWYPPLWGGAQPGWTLEQHPQHQDPGVLIVGKAWETMRFDYRGWLHLLARGLPLLIAGHATMDPMRRTTGVYRDWYKGIAVGLRTLAHGIAASIQITREIDILTDSRTLGSPWPPGSWSADILADGWPVGAVDTILGSCTYDTKWRPTENGFPSLADLSSAVFDGSPRVLPPKYAFAYALSKAKADTLRRFRWLQLYLGHPAIFKLLGFAAIFDEMATPPKASETVTFTGPAWVGVRHAQGTEEVEAGGGQLCEAKKFTADVFTVERTGSVSIGVQPRLFRWGSHMLKYRILLGSYSYGAPGPYPAMLHDEIELARHDTTEFTARKGEITLNCPTFRWLVDKPGDGAVGRYALPVMHVLGGLPDEPYLRDYYGPHPKLSAGNQPVVTAQVAVTGPPLVADTPIIEAQGVMRPSGFRDVTFSYRLEAGDGTIELEIENNAHPAAAANVLLWLVIEEPIGQAETIPPFRTGLPLFVIGLEHHVPKEFFAYEASCNRRAGQLLRGAIEHAVASGLPIPEPDPRGETYPAYVHRVIQEVGRG